MAKGLDVDAEVAFLGTLSREDASRLMRKSDIFLSTSNRKEGWGATVNEAMASGCALVASNAVGAVPFLVGDGFNGIKFKSENFDDLSAKVIALCNEPDKIEQLSHNAITTMDELWNANAAAKRFVEYSKALLEGEAVDYSSGPMSPCKVGGSR